MHKVGLLSGNTEAPSSSAGGKTAIPLQNRRQCGEQSDIRNSTLKILGQKGYLDSYSLDVNPAAYQVCLVKTPIRSQIVFNALNLPTILLPFLFSASPLLALLAKSICSRQHGMRLGVSFATHSGIPYLFKVVLESIHVKNGNFLSSGKCKSL